MVEVAVEFCSHHAVVLIATRHYGYTLSKLSSPRGTAVSCEMSSFNAPQNSPKPFKNSSLYLKWENLEINEDTIFVWHLTIMVNKTKNHWIMSQFHIPPTTTTTTTTTKLLTTKSSKNWGNHISKSIATTTWPVTSRGIWPSPPAAWSSPGFQSCGGRHCLQAPGSSSRQQRHLCARRQRWVGSASPRWQAPASSSWRCRDPWSCEASPPSEPLACSTWCSWAGHLCKGCQGSACSCRLNWKYHLCIITKIILVN